jgi:dephospho-CoA kinase
MVIAVTGMPGAGKSEVGKALGRMGYEVYELGDVVREMMKASGVPATRKATSAFAIMIRKKCGKLVTTKRLLGRLKPGRRDKVAIIGIRSGAEEEYIRKRTGAIVIAVVAPLDLRFRRLKARGRYDAPKTLKDMADRDLREIGFGILSAIRGADYVVAGDGTVLELRKSVAAIIESMDKERGNAPRRINTGKAKGF